MATGVDKHIFAYGDVFPEISIKRWKYTKQLRYFITEQFGQQSAYFIRRMVSHIQTESDATEHYSHKGARFSYIQQYDEKLINTIYIPVIDYSIKHFINLIPD